MKTLGLGAGGLALSSSVAGANLLSGTTIGGNTAWHSGNDGSGSGLNADTVDGKDASDLGGGKIQKGWDGSFSTKLSNSGHVSSPTGTTYMTAFSSAGNPSYTFSNYVRFNLTAHATTGTGSTTVSVSAQFKRNGNTIMSTTATAYTGDFSVTANTGTIYKTSITTGDSFTASGHMNGGAGYLTTDGAVSASVAILDS